MTAVVRRLRRRAAMTRRWLLPSPERSAWRRAWHLAETTPRFTPGRIRMLDYDLQYADLLSFCPQWEDIFVKRTLEFQSATQAPRILDCGANVGLASLYYKRRYPSARITAYEADPAIFAMLDANLRVNGADDVERIHAAVWTRTGDVSFRCEGSDSGMIDALPGAVQGEATSVPGIRLRDALAAAPVDLLKLDIEGAEGAVLDDCEPALIQVRAIVMDLHELDPDSRQAPQVLDRLTRAGFQYAIDDFVALTWRPPQAGDDSPFPGRAMNWAMTIRAWRPA